MQWITDTKTLAQFCRIAAKSNFVTLDTEFIRETTFWPKLCLIQMASDTDAAIIDPLAPDLSLEPFYALLQSDTRKVLHGCRQDIEIFYQATKQIPKNIMDTQIMAMACHDGEAAGYDKLVKMILGHTLSKTSRTTNWDARPLSDAQRNYALADVTHLRTLYERLDATLQKKRRSHWIAEEMVSLLSIQNYDTNPELAWQRFGTNGNAKNRNIAYALCIWREREAQARNIPRRRILRDDIIRALAQQPPASETDFLQMRNLPVSARQPKVAKRLMPIITQAKQVKPQDVPQIIERFPAGPIRLSTAVLNMLKILLAHTSTTHKVASKLLTSTDELIYLATTKTPDCPIVHGWRYEIFGQYALALLRGELAITSQNGITKLIPLTSAASSKS